MRGHQKLITLHIASPSSSLCSASVDKQLCHMAAGFEDSTIVLWSLNGYENYGRKPFQSLDDRLCQWSINNCNRMLSDDLSDYEDEEEILSNLRDTTNEEETEASTSVQTKSRRVENRYKKQFSIGQQWSDFTSKGCSENNL